MIIQIAVSAPSSAEQAPLTVFAAASTQQAVEAVLKTCPAEISRPCRGVFAASSTLARQISGGAPADIYISANLKWMRYLVDNNLVPEARVTVLASNRLVAIAPKTHEIAIANEPELADWLGRDRVAIGDPAHVPAGIYAEQALQALGIWQALQGHMLRMPNVRAALAVVARAEANAGIVYATDAAVSGDVNIVYRFDASLHAPIRYPMAPVGGRESPDTDKLLALFLSDTGKMAFKAAGFEVAAD
jgi:molybdate transport system substrate-binding protein